MGCVSSSPEEGLEKLMNESSFLIDLEVEDRFTIPIDSHLEN
jgi:hypothetical protein